MSPLAGVASLIVSQVKGEPAFRLRVGDWRVIHELQHGELIVLVLRIGPRGGVYR